MKKCPICQKKEKNFNAGIKSAYKLGLMDGEDKLKKTINLLAITNKRLFDELTRLDVIQPLEHADNVVYIPINILEKKVYPALNKYGHHYITRKIKALVEKQTGNIAERIKSSL